MPFCSYDNKNKVDRRSYLGEYKVDNKIPKNPKGRTGIIGRGSLKFWGPNHAILALISRIRKDTKTNREIIEILVMKDEDEWKIPEVKQNCFHFKEVFKFILNIK